MSNLNELEPQIRFLNDSLPKLEAGTYQIDIKHDILDVSHHIEGNYKKSQQFIVQAPRFALPPNSVQAQFPVPESGTDFHASLPFIVFKEDQLPWCRTINAALKGTPWLALMVFRPDEIVQTKPADRDPDPYTDLSPTLATTRNVIGEVENYHYHNILGPKIDLDRIEKTGNRPLRANTIDVLYGTFKQLAPRTDELPFLAHIRKTDSGGLAADGEHGSRSYATLLANRLANPNTEEQYIAHVVSLEGWAGFLPGDTNASPPADSIILRLVSLYSWKFNNKKAGVNFSRLIETMSVDTLKLPFTPPVAWGTDKSKYTVAQKEIQEKYESGYIALNYDARTGEKTFAWYRGPFAPVKPVVITRLVPKSEEGGYKTYVTTADKAIIYNADTGVFDHSYAVAWELGRMITLGNRPAAIAIWQWKKTVLQKMQVLNRMVSDKQKRRKQLLGTTANLGLTALLDGLDWRQMRDDLMDDQAGKYIFMNYLGNELGQHILGDEENEPAISTLDPTGLYQHLDSMPGLLSKSEMLKAIADGIDPHVLISDKLDAALKMYSDTDHQ